MASNSVCQIPESRIIQLARIISESVAKIDEALSEQGLEPLSFDDGAPAGYLPSEVSGGVRDAVIDATAELHDLLLEPLHLIKAYSGSNNSVCMQAIARYGIASMVPPGDQMMSFADIGKRTGLGEQMAARLLRHAMTMRVFREPEPGLVAHTKASRLLASPEMTAWMRIGTEEMWPAATKMLDALEKWPGSQEPNETAYSLSQNSMQSIYETIGSNPEKSARFAWAMAVWATRPDYSPSHVINGYDWAALGNQNSHNHLIKVVDVGGARGHVAAALAQRFPNLDVLVQDMEMVVAGAAAALPEQHLVRAGRVRFEAHDLFAAQTTSSAVGADVFFFRWILHNWADKHCVATLRAQIPALKPGARILVMDTCMPEPGVDYYLGEKGEDVVKTRAIPLWMERDLRSEDLNMGAIFNSRERTLREWKALFTEADPAFVLGAVTKPEGSALTVMEVMWLPSSN
ncbi:S-adenosyl-L-methionine-dependent methyltransferase [Apodospora peruviana]|uniref:S-adenosyl-L-methionine-dependent methyltransferase n=1 Tax=Apodospora peruviana TaxID=516989 RepID=A0AAE0IRR5_9PEZI|nr:S-adenosyl-L-methionine-dependent methyltransferase [Apodospora peruviana]